MPSGVFKPYAGVSTAILIFTKTNTGGTEKVWFYDMKADGFSLDDKRSPVKENDIPDIVERFHNLKEEELRTKKEQSFYVNVEEIRNNDYNFSIKKYKEIEKKQIIYDKPKVILSKVYEIENIIAEKLQLLKSILEEE